MRCIQPLEVAEEMPADDTALLLFPVVRPKDTNKIMRQVKNKNEKLKKSSFEKSIHPLNSVGHGV